VVNNIGLQHKDLFDIEITDINKRIKKWLQEKR